MWKRYCNLITARRTLSFATSYLYCRATSVEASLGPTLLHFHFMKCKRGVGPRGGFAKEIPKEISVPNTIHTRKISCLHVQSLLTPQPFGWRSEYVYERFYVWMLLRTENGHKTEIISS